MPTLCYLIYKMSPDHYLFFFFADINGFFDIFSQTATLEGEIKEELRENILNKYNTH